MSKQTNWQTKLYDFLSVKKNKLIVLLIFTASYLILFTILAVLKKNYEFVFYSIFLFAILLFVRFYYKDLRLTVPILVLLSFFGALHTMGVNIYIGNTRLYEIYIYPRLFRYDNLVHIVGSFTAAMISFNFLRPYIESVKIKSKTVTLIIIVLIALGFGAVNEILELGAVVFVDAQNQVGDYMNNALDLCFNLLGSTLAAFYIRSYMMEKKEERNK